MRKLLMAVALATGVWAAQAEMWTGLDAANWVSGPKITELHLLGKVVFVCTWDPSDAESKGTLARAEKVWQSYRSKPFLVLGSVAGDASSAKAATADVTFPNYIGAAHAQHGGGRIGFCVVNHHGKVVYGGGDERAAEEALVTALGYVGRPYVLTEGIAFGKKHPYRSMEKKLVLGKSISSCVKTLESDVKKGESKAATKAQRAKAATAGEILAAIATAKIDVQREIESIRESYPIGALKLVRQASVTYPDLAETYKKELPDLEAKAAEQKAKLEALKAEKAAAKKTGGKAK